MSSIRSVVKQQQQQQKQPETAGPVVDKGKEEVDAPKTEKKISYRNVLAIVNKALITVSLVYEVLAEMEPFKQDMVYSVDMKRWKFAIFHLMRNIFTASNAYKDEHPELFIPTGDKITEKHLFELIRSETKTGIRLKDPSKSADLQIQATLNWVVSTAIEIAKDHAVFKVDFDGDITDMTAQEWKDNCNKVAQAINDAYDIDEANVFFTQHVPKNSKTGELITRVFVSSDQIYDIVMDNPGMAFTLNFDVAGQSLSAEVYEPGVCAWPWRDMNTGHIDSFYAVFDE
jgi:hypothetical protein